MNQVARAAVATIAVATATLLSACGPDGATAQPDPSSASSVSTSSAAPSPSSAPTAAESTSPKAQAEAAVVAYWELLDRLATDPSLSLSELPTVARGEARTQWQQLLTSRRAAQYRQVGSIVVEDLEAKTSGAGQWDVTACIDVNQVDVVDKAGKSVQGDGPKRLEYVFVVERDGERFFVLKDTVVAQC